MNHFIKFGEPLEFYWVSCPDSILRSYHRKSNQATRSYAEDSAEDFSVDRAVDSMKAHRRSNISVELPFVLLKARADPPPAQEMTNRMTL